jgi:hydrogenase maturation protease
MEDNTADAPRKGCLVIGVGNDWRGDDSIGLRVVRGLEGRQVDGLRTVQSGGDAAALMGLWEGWDRVYLVDAMRSGSPPGSVLRVLASQSDFGSRPDFRSSHLLGVEEAILLARVLGRIPKTLVIFGVEGGSFDLGAPISPEVASAGEEVVRRIVEEVYAANRQGSTTRGPRAPSSPS